MSPALGGGFFTAKTTWEAHIYKSHIDTKELDVKNLQQQQPLELEDFSGKS